MTYVEIDEMMDTCRNTLKHMQKQNEELKKEVRCLRNEVQYANKYSENLIESRNHLAGVLGKALNGLPKEVVMAFLAREFLQDENKKLIVCVLTIKKAFGMDLGEAKRLMDEYR